MNLEVQDWLVRASKNCWTASQDGDRHLALAVLTALQQQLPEIIDKLRKG